VIDIIIMDVSGQPNMWVVKNISGQMSSLSKEDLD
jgi:hypothetical protein